MKQLKEIINQILINIPNTRDSRMLLNWEVLKEKGFINKDENGNEYLSIYKEDFMKNNSESIRRCSQALQRADLLSGSNLIQPTKNIKEKREKLSKEKGFRYMEAKDQRGYFDEERGIYVQY